MHKRLILITLALMTLLTPTLALAGVLDPPPADSSIQPPPAEETVSPPGSPAPPTAPPPTGPGGEVEANVTKPKTTPVAPCDPATSTCTTPPPNTPTPTCDPALSSCDNTTPVCDPALSSCDTTPVCDPAVSSCDTPPCDACDNSTPPTTPPTTPTTPTCDPVKESCDTTVDPCEIGSDKCTDTPPCEPVSGPCGSGDDSCKPGSCEPNQPTTPDEPKEIVPKSVPEQLTGKIQQIIPMERFLPHTGQDLLWFILLGLFLITTGVVLHLKRN